MRIKATNLKSTLKNWGKYNFLILLEEMRHHINYYFLSLVILLTGFGMFFLATLSAPISLKFFGDTNYYLFHQLIALVIGFIAALIVLKIPISFLKKIAPFLLLINLFLLVLVFFPGIGTKFWGAKRWISIGQNTFQPSEFLKISAIIYLSAFLSHKFFRGQKRGLAYLVKKGYYNFTKIFLPFLLLLATITVLLYLQKDASTMGIIGATLIMIYFASGTPLWHTILAFLTGLGSISFFVLVEPYRIERLKTIFYPEADPLGVGLQLKQSLIALGSGGIFGKGLGLSTQKFGFLPQAMSDSVFAVIGEEIGIIGSSVVIILFLLLAWSGFKIASSSADEFSKLMGVGISTWIVLQTLVNITSIIGIFPLSGIPLPFFSYGGSHLIAEMIGMGILLKISKNS